MTGGESPRGLLNKTEDKGPEVAGTSASFSHLDGTDSLGLWNGTIMKLLCLLAEVGVGQIYGLIFKTTWAFLMVSDADCCCCILKLTLLGGLLTLPE